LAEKHTAANLFANQFPIPFSPQAPLGALRSYRGNQLAKQFHEVPLVLG